MKKIFLSAAFVAALFGSVYAGNTSNIVGAANESAMDSDANQSFTLPVDEDDSTTTTTTVSNTTTTKRTTTTTTSSTTSFE